MKAKTRPTASAIILSVFNYGKSKGRLVAGFMRTSATENQHYYIASSTGILTVDGKQYAYSVGSEHWQDVTFTPVGFTGFENDPAFTVQSRQEAYSDNVTYRILFPGLTADEIKRVFHMVPQFRGGHYGGCGTSFTLLSAEDGAGMVEAYYGIGD